MPASIKHLTDKKLNLTSLLAKWQDGLYYTAAIVKCDKANKRCFVCFEDGSEVWIKNRDLHLQLTLDQLNEDEDIVCCFCDDGTSQAPNEIILCDVCNQGYHQKCHNPPVDSSTIDDSDDTNDHKDWICSTCTYILNQSDRATEQVAQKRIQPEEAPPPQKQAKLEANKQPEVQRKQPAPAPVPVPQQPKPKQPQQLPQQQQPQQPQQQLPPSSPSQQSAQSPQAVQQQKPPVKVKQTPISQQQHSTKPTTGSPKPGSGSPKPTVTNIVQKQTPYYPLSSQVRAAVTSSSSTTTSPVVVPAASSTIVVGNAVGRSKQDVVNQSNKSSQRQRQPPVEPQTSPNASQVKHAVRKSSVNFMPPVRQSALPVATRSPIPNIAPSAKSPQLSPAGGMHVMVPAPSNSDYVHSSTNKSAINNTNITSSSTNIVTSTPKQASPAPSQFSEPSLIRGEMDTNNKVGGSNGGPILQVLEPRARPSIITSTQIGSVIARPATWTVESHPNSASQRPPSSPSFPLAKISGVVDGIPISLATNNGNGNRPASSAKVVSSLVSQSPTSSVATDGDRTTSSQPTVVLNIHSDATDKSS